MARIQVALPQGVNQGNSQNYIRGVLQISQVNSQNYFRGVDRLMKEIVNHVCFNILE